MSLAQRNQRETMGARILREVAGLYPPDEEEDEAARRSSGEGAMIFDPGSGVLRWGLDLETFVVYERADASGYDFTWSSSGIPVRVHGWAFVCHTLASILWLKDWESLRADELAFWRFLEIGLDTYCISRYHRNRGVPARRWIFSEMAIAHAVSPIPVFRPVPAHERLAVILAARIHRRQEDDQ